MKIDQTCSFVGWVFGLSAPFFVVGTLAAGDDVEALPVTALVAVVPAVAAVIVTHRRRGSWRELLIGSLRRPRRQARRWLTAAIVAMPVLVLVSHAIAVSRDPEPGGVSAIAVAAVVALALVGAIGEEVGWTSFATRRLLQERSVLAAALLVATLWATWHLIPFVHTNNSWSWIAWQTAFTVVFRVLITLCFVESGGSTLVAILLHASYNVAWSLLSSVRATYDPAVMTIVTAAATTVVLALHRGAARRPARPERRVAVEA